MSSSPAPGNNRPVRGKAEPVPRPSILKDDTLEAVAEFIAEGKAKNIIVMSGAGISTAAGIPDFRSPGTGLYDALGKYNLPYPEAVFDISFFKDTPSPFYRLAKELFPGNFRPTLTHYFLPLLAKKKLLLRSYTQNIDMLERLTGIDEELLVEAHGSFATSKCIKCSLRSESDYVKRHIMNDQIPYCSKCGGLVKPEITFFGEDLPVRFGKLAQVDFKKCDLLIVLGTSLQVEPFNRLITRVPAKCPRLLINRDRAGEGMRMGFDFDDKWKHPVKRDALFLGNCDEGVRKLAQLCGWEDELQALYDEGHIQMKLAEEMEALALSENDKTKSTDNSKETIKKPEEAKEETKKEEAKETQVDMIKDELEEIIEKFETSTVISTTTTTTEEEAVKGEGSEVTKTIETDVILLSKA
ncbi:NAD-dependent protein deacetylase sirtuin-2 [Podila verticillata]|nr:NAD-dependent protein deacetylase sirtuin-2 [Podila verticillata]